MAKCTNCGMPLTGGLFIDQCFCPKSAGNKVSVNLTTGRSTQPIEWDFTGIPRDLRTNPSDKMIYARDNGIAIPVGWNVLPRGAKRSSLTDFYWHAGSWRWVEDDDAITVHIVIRKIGEPIVFA